MLLDCLLPGFIENCIIRKLTFSKWNSSLSLSKHKCLLSSMEERSTFSLRTYYVLDKMQIWASHGFDRGHAAEEASPTAMG